jgi:hypothetical protein
MVAISVFGLTFTGKLGQYTYWMIRDVHVTAFDRYWGTLFMAMGLVELLALAGGISLIVGVFRGGGLGRAGLIALLLALAAWVLLIPRLEHWASGHPITNPYF